MTTRDQIVDAAREFIGTPFRHQGRLKHKGVDCVGLIIGVANALGISDYDTTDYTRQPNAAFMGAELSAHLDSIPFSSVLPGDILWFLIDGDPQHLSIVTTIEPTFYMVHASNARGINKCVEHRLSNEWRRKVRACFRYRDID